MMTSEPTWLASIPYAAPSSSDALASETLLQSEFAVAIFRLAMALYI